MNYLRLFGGASLECDGATLSGPATQRHRLALLSLLCVSHPRSLSRDKLLGYLWPERDAEHARNLLKQAVHVLRRTLGDDVILSLGDDLQLGTSPLDCDLLAFEEALATGDLERATGLYAGPLLDGFFLSDAPAFEHWLDQERERLRRDWRSALTELADQRGVSGDTDSARDCWQRLLADDPHDARATVGLMEVLEQLGDRAGAIRQAHLHELLLAEDFGAGPDQAVRTVADRIRAGDAATEPAPATERPAIDGTPQAPREGPSGAFPGNGTITTDIPRGGSSPWRRTTGIAAVLLVLASLAWVSARAWSDRPAEITSVAVLPLANLTGDPSQEYFVAGMHDALISELAQIEALTVYSRQSVLRFQDSDAPLPAVAKELGVDALVEGAVFKSGDSVRISVQLVRAQPEELLVSKTFTGPLNRALALQSEVARALVEGMRARVTPAVRARMGRTRTVDPAAQDAYLAGLYHLGRASYGQILPDSERQQEKRVAIAKFEEVVALDSTWAPGYAKLALAYHWLASGVEAQSDENFRRSKAAALHALALDSTEAQAWASLGFVLYQHEFDWAGAEQAIRRAIELEPNSHHWIYASYLRDAGRYDEASAEYQKAEARDPLSDLLKVQIAGAYSCAGRHDEAIAKATGFYHRISAEGTTGVIGDTAWFLRFTAAEYSISGKHAEGIEAAEQLVEMTDTLSSGDVLAFALAMGGRRAEARSLVAWIEEHHGENQFPASMYAALGDTARAIGIVDSLIGMRDLGVVHARCWNVFKVMPDEPQLQALLRRAGIPE